MDSSAGPMEEPNRDQDLYRQLAKGHEGAFCSLYEKYQGPIFRFAWHMSGNNATAEDVTQEVFMQLIRNPKKLRSRKGFGGRIFVWHCAESHAPQSGSEPARRTARRGLDGRE
jgi:hypothetical protein